MFWDFTIRFRQIVVVLGVMLLTSACAPAVQPTPTATPTPSATSTPEATPLPEIELARDLPEGSAEGGNQAAIK